MTTFVERYKPQSFSELVFADDWVAADVAQFAQHELNAHVILFGDYGTGKSTTARLIAEERQWATGHENIWVEPFHATALNQNFNQLENMLNLLHSLHPNETCPTAIIDEVDQLTPSNQKRLRGFIDTLRTGQIVMTTNSLTGIDGGIRDRCERIELIEPQSIRWLSRAQAILEAEHVVVDDKALLNVLRRASTMREVLRALEKTVAWAGRQAKQAPPTSPTSAPIVPFGTWNKQPDPTTTC